MSNNTSNNNITPDVFNQNFNVKVVRLDLYPAESPTAWCTGFQISNKSNGKQMYIDVQVLLDSLTPDTSDDSSIVQAGWAKVSDQVLSWATGVQKQSSVINQKFTPTF